MLKFFDTFRKDEDGAVSVDWIVITAAVVGMSAVAFFTVEDASFALMDAAGGAVAAENDF
ncbi:Flp family type IVb pilin [Thalassococcus sp. BH17M4-6]|uniref:Flp family type IVb pilin n=1 Tax=Thalassococcus sp. BH17M4-6 TaxID=3413148 RepID=UPI003BDB33CA